MPRLPVLVALAAAVLAAPASAAAQKKPRVAITDLRALGTEASAAELLSEIALTEATAIAGVEVIGRSEINAVLGLEKQKAMLGCAEEGSCLAEIAGALGVDYVLVGSVGRIGQLYRLDMKLLDARKARARDRVGETIQAQQELLLAAVQRAVHKLLDPLGAAPAGLAQGPAASPSPPVTLPAPPAALAPAPPRPRSAAEPAAAPPSGSGWRRGVGYAATGLGAAFLVGAFANSTQASDNAHALATWTPASLCAFDCLNGTQAHFLTYADRYELFVALGAVSLGPGLWLGLTGDSPAPGTPATFLGMSQRTWGYALAGTGVLSGLIGLGMGSKAADAERASRLAAAIDPTKQRAADDYRRLARDAYTVAALGVGAGATLWFTGGPRAPAVAVLVEPLQGGAVATLAGRF